MAKKVMAMIKLQIPAGQATPAPPVGPALGQHGVNIMEFCKTYNERTQAQQGNVVPVEITVFEDRSFTFVTKTPPAAKLLLKAAKIESIDYKDTPLLRKFISDRGKIRARRVTGVTVQEQRRIATAVKNAREMALLPYSSSAR